MGKVTYPTERNTVDLPEPLTLDALQERVAGAFPGASATQDGESFKVLLPNRDGGLDPYQVSFGDRIIFELDSGFTIDNWTKYAQERWTEEAAAKKRAKELYHLARAREQAEAQERRVAMMESGDLRSRIMLALDNVNHEFCAAHSEGQWCCIDIDNPDSKKVIDAIVAAVEQS